jgi:hypothetical protein
MQHRGGKAGPVYFGRQGGSRRQAAAREHHRHQPRSWVPLARSEKTQGAMARVPQWPWRGQWHTNGNGRCTNSEGVSDAGDCHADEWLRERGRAARPAMGGRERCGSSSTSAHWGRGWTDDQPRRETQVAATQVSGIGSEGARRGR